MSRPQRRMIPLPSAQELTQGPNAIRLHKKKDRFLFMTYNLLAQALVRRDMFPHATQKALRWKFRKQNILQEFLGFAPDLACLQEVDFWDEVYYPALTKAGYETAYYKNQNKKHGCAIIWRKTRFEKVEQKTLEYDDHGQPTFTTGNIGLMVALKPLKQAAKNPDPNADMVLPDEDDEKEDTSANGHAELPGGILVATTHLFWRPDGSYERLRQASILLDKIQEWNKDLNYTILLGGDFNTTPRDAAYRAMTRNEMPAQQIPNLQKWLEDEVDRVQKAEAAAAEAAEAAAALAAQQAQAQQDGDSVDQLVAQAEKLTLGGTKNGASNGTTTGEPKNDLPYRAPPTGIILPKQAPAVPEKDAAADLPYRAPPTGIILPKQATNGASNGDSKLDLAVLPQTMVDSKTFKDSIDPKLQQLAAITASGEDAPVVAPLEAFTPAQDLKTAIEAHPRCVSIYGQYETLTKDDPAEVNEAAAAQTAATESTASAPPAVSTHGEPTFTNFATWFKDTLDYVYLYDQPIPESGAQLVPLRLLEIPDKSFLGHGLPDENFSSDHLCLMVEFAILLRP
ncbi:Endonuclease/exonuclease/phosphatase [Linnemannia elongata AG-77]|uniref:Endonuclease/exonuclease/phosphatase n=1 Tax=Linnemannia elongata AG-77 TaxID=1314771 RepID=A0A197K9A1_9FUNG|nr:Endonuclease/exonuclease/phosphatase [Linnemannia elongata AG-77]